MILTPGPAVGPGMAVPASGVNLEPVPGRKNCCHSES